MRDCLSYTFLNSRSYRGRSLLYLAFSTPIRGIDSAGKLSEINARSKIDGEDFIQRGN
ncbi:unnamed protein product [Acidithrix sp. C25]|nr:unnamed protein product [Acidithrix sp. C25]